MKKRILLILFILFFPWVTKAADKQELLLVNINFDSGKFSLGEVYSKPGYLPEKNNENSLDGFNYRIRIVSFAGEVLDERVFSVNPVKSYAPLAEGEVSDGPSGEVFESQVQTMAILPYYNDAKFIELYDANRNFVERKDIAYLSDVCGDKTCQEHESFENCPEDCPAAGKDDYCDLNNMEGDSDCKNINIVKTESQEASSTIEDIEKKETNIKYFIFGGIAFVILIFIYVAYYFLVKKNNELS